MGAQDLMKNNDPIKQLRTKYKELENGYKGWLAKQSLPVEAAVVTLSSAAQGVAISYFTASYHQSQGLIANVPFIQARNYAVVMGVNAGISSVMKRIRGKEDVQTCMVSAFGTGAMYSLVADMWGPNRAASAISYGVVFALLNGGIYKVGEKFSKSPDEDAMYIETRSMLSRLGLEKYEKNFKKGLLTDRTLPLLDDRQALRDVRIPTGPRLVILDDIQRNKVVNIGGRRS